ncbi:MAG: hypothetical protein KI792_03085 [Alphaproteobacteria bacterium]|nr:hypothetical protein [Alphaproteobacteria bacterium SS10]
MPFSSDNRFSRLIGAAVLTLTLTLTLTMVMPGAAWAQRGDGVQQVPLTRNQPGAGLGILDPGRDGGMSLNLWQSTDAALASALVQSTPADIHVPALRSLARRALASTAIAPRGSDASFALDRAEALLKLGYLDEAASLARSARNNGAARADRLRATALLLEGDEDGACVVLRETDRDNDPDGINADGFWDRLDLLCQLADNNTGAANFLINLLREAGDTDDAVLAAASALAADSRIENPLDAVDPINQAVALTILIKAGASLPDSPTLLTRLAHLNQQDGELKDVPGALDSLVLLARHGWLEADEFQGGLASAGFRTADFEDPLGTADQGTPGEAALLLSALASETLDAAKAQLLAAAWERAKPIDGALVPAFIGGLATIQPGPGTEVIAPAAFFLLAAHGEADRAALWLRQAGQDPSAVIASFAQRLAQPAGTPPSLPQSDEFAPVQAVAAAALAGTGQAPTTQALAAALATPAGDANDGDLAALTALLSAPEGDASLGQRSMAALLLAGNRSSTELSPLTLALLTDALHRGGLVEEARDMARQAVLNAAMAANLDGTGQNDE